MKICWGETWTENANGYVRTATATFPFTYNVIPVVVAAKIASGNSAEDCRSHCTLGGVSKTTASFNVVDPNGGIANINFGVRWISIGY